MIKTTKTMLQQSVKLKITREEILFLLKQKYNIPENASVYVNVSGGGDWSNCELDIDFDSKLIERIELDRTKHMMRII